MLVRIFFLCLLLLPACGKMDVLHMPAPGIQDAQKVCIVNHPATKEGFQRALESWLSKEGVQYEILPANSSPDVCEWSLTYYGRWSWDMAIFLSDAQITAFQNGERVGEEKLIVGQWDKHKFENGEKRIHKMMDMLYGKAIHYTPTNTLN